MNGYKHEIEVDVHDVDYNGVCRAASLLRFLQTTAELQLTESGMSYGKLREMNRAFIISKIRAEFYRPVHALDKLEAFSFPCDSRGFSFVRCYSLMKDGITVGRAISVWALVDTESRALVKVNDFDLGIPTLPPLDIALGHIRMPSALRKVGEYTVCYADIDQNRHVNNTRYADIFANFLPMEDKRMCAITVSYVNEARLGDTLDVHLACEEGNYYVRTVRPDGKINTEAEIRLFDAKADFELQ